MAEKTRNSLFYRVIDDCEDSYYELDDFFVLDDDPELAAQEAAEDYFTNHDGWESNWPLTIALHETEGGPEKCRFRVDLETEPVFCAKRVKS